MPCIISALAKRGDIIVDDRSQTEVSSTINSAFQDGLKTSRSTVRWLDHDDIKR